MADASSYDVVVIGGGPAGSLVASLVRRQDPTRNVLVLERAVFPRHHVGESCTPAWRPILQRAGVLEQLEASDVMRKVGVLFEWGPADDERWTVDFRDPTTGGASVGAYQIDRARFDHTLLKHARSLGATVLEGVTVKAVERLDPSGFRVQWSDGRGEPREAIAANIVDASGQARLLARLFGLRVIPFDDMNNFAVYGYWRGSGVAQFMGPPAHERERSTYIAAVPDGWLWHIPIEPDLVGVGLVTDAEVIPAGGAAALEEVYLRNVHAAKGVHELLANAELTTHPHAASKLLTIRDWAYRVEPACGDGWFLVGDAAAFVDPILSSGLSIGAHGASLAANALHTFWTNPSIDAELLRRSYTAAYEDMAASFHRLAAIWYSRAFKYTSWPSEAKHMRLRTGRHPADETSAEAFLHMALGAFVNPLDGAFGDPGFRQVDIEPHVRLLQAHLYKGEGGDDPEFDARDLPGARRILQERATARWRELLGRRVAVRRCTYREHEGYFTDRDKDCWERVRYAELAPAGVDDRFQRVVFPAENVVPLLRGEVSLREAVRSFCASTPVGTGAYGQRVKLAQQQVLQLDLRGWLDDDGASPPSRAAWPPLPLARAGYGPAVVDLMGDSIALGPPAAQILLTPATISRQGHAFATTATTAFAYRGALGAVRPALDALIEGFRRWEREDSGAAHAFWSDMAAFAGEALEIAAP